jgi:L,D-transpeptidase catalytic domain
VQRVVLVLALALVPLVACVTGDERGAPSGSPALAAGQSAALALISGHVAHLAEPAAEQQASARRQRVPWIESVDEIGRRYPLYGVTLYHMAYVYGAAKKGVRPIGYLRRGARFRASEEVSRVGCARGWFAVAGGGFVCAGDGVSVDGQPPPYVDPPALPSLSDALPYPYVKIMSADVPQYLRLPTAEEERSVGVAFASSRADPSASTQAITVNDAGVPVVDALPSELSGLVRARMQPGYYVSVDRVLTAEQGGEGFLRTVRGGLLRTRDLSPSKQPLGLGVALGSRYQLPLAFVYRGGAPALRLDPVRGELVKAEDELAVHSAHALTGASIVRGGRRYYVTRDGLYLRDTAVRIVDRVARPPQVPKNQRWIRVDLERQTLTAYEGETPVFATLVSSGLPDHATPAGIYRLHAKHVTTTMADDLAADGPYSIEDVPWTMYFLGSYALHAAFWHERFGHPRSHGCVNLAPRDARWLFFWTLPELPSGWHGVLADVGEGTTVVLDDAVPYPIEQSP